ncbi:hypothetical protein HA402_009527 [Bradysia odoriphaga]|nr:hypothetical protein HA402_009527 [Bradysia odoriphaga]
MDAYHRDIIISNIDTLIEWTDYDKLKDDCMSRNILSIDTIHEIEETSDDTKLLHDQLLRKITQVEANALNVLVEIYRASNFWDAADFLSSFEKPKSDQIIRTFRSQCNLTEPVGGVEKDGNILGNASSRNGIEDLPLQPFTENVNATFNVIRAERFCSSRILSYSMKSKHRGVLFLVNIINIKDKPNLHRNGAILDKDQLITLFQQFGFQIFYYEDLTLKEFRHLVEQLISSRYLRVTDCLVFCVLSHGCFKDGHQMIQFSDGANGSIEDVIVKFSNRSCPNLRRKPKLFIFPMCRGISSKIKVKTFDARNPNLQVRQCASLFRYKNLLRVSERIRNVP